MLKRHDILIALEGLQKLLKNNSIFLQIEIFDKNFKKVNSLFKKNINFKSSSTIVIFGLKNKFSLIFIVAEREGFEPSVPLTVHTLSKRAD